MNIDNYMTRRGKHRSPKLGKVKGAKLVRIGKITGNHSRFSSPWIFSAPNMLYIHQEIKVEEFHHKRCQQQ